MEIKFFLIFTILNQLIEIEDSLENYWFIEEIQNLKDNPVNINSASENELRKLFFLSDEEIFIILKERKRKKFENFEDLKERCGISDFKIELLKKYAVIHKPVKKFLNINLQIREGKFYIRNHSAYGKVKIFSLYKDSQYTFCLNYRNSFYLGFYSLHYGLGLLLSKGDYFSSSIYGRYYLSKVGYTGENIYRGAFLTFKFFDIFANDTFYGFRGKILNREKMKFGFTLFDRINQKQINFGMDGKLKFFNFEFALKENKVTYGFLFEDRFKYGKISTGYCKDLSWFYLRFKKWNFWIGSKQDYIRVWVSKDFDFSQIRFRFKYKFYYGKNFLSLKINKKFSNFFESQIEYGFDEDFYNYSTIYIKISKFLSFGYQQWISEDLIFYIYEKDLPYNFNITPLSEKGNSYWFLFNLPFKNFNIGAKIKFKNSKIYRWRAGVSLRKFWL